MKWLVVFIFFAFDLFAYVAGARKGIDSEWYHALPGGGFVRLVESFSEIPVE